MVINGGGVRLCGQVDGVEIDAGRRPIAPPNSAPRAQERPHAAQQLERAPGGLKRALKGSTGHLRAPTAYLRHAYAHLARRSIPSRPRGAHAVKAPQSHVGAAIRPEPAQGDE